MEQVKLRSWVIVVAAVTIVASACSSTDSNASLRETAVAGEAQERSTPPSSQAVDEDQRLTVARVGAEAGGVVELAGRARLTIPPGALTDNAEVRLTAIGAAPSAIAFPLEQAVAPPVDIEIRGAELTEPATLELLFDTDLVVLPDDPVIATPSQWDEEQGWVQVDATIDVDEGIVSTSSESPDGWWRSSVWDWSRLPAVIDALFVGLDEAEVAEPGCTTPVPSWVERVEVGGGKVDPAYLCAGGFEGQLAVRMTNRRPFTLGVDSTQAPAWGWTNTRDRVHLLLSEIVRSAQPSFEPQLILPRFTEGAVGIDPGNFPGGRILGQATSTTMAIDVAVLVLEALDGGGQLGEWKSLLACAIPPRDGAVDPSDASKIVERLWRCVDRFSESDRFPPGYGDAVVATLDRLVETDSFADGVEDMMSGSSRSSGFLYWTDPALVKDEPTPTPTTVGGSTKPLPLPKSTFTPTSPTPPPSSPVPRPVPIPPVPTTQPPAPPTTKKPPPPKPPPTQPPPTQPPPTQPPPTQPPPTQPPPTQPPPTQPPPTQPPPTQPPPTQPPPTQPPPTQPPPTQPPPTQPPPTQPPPTQPPTTS